MVRGALPQLHAHECRPVPRVSSTSFKSLKSVWATAWEIAAVLLAFAGTLESIVTGNKEKVALTTDDLSWKGNANTTARLSLYYSSTLPALAESIRALALRNSFPDIVLISFGLPESNATALQSGMDALERAVIVAQAKARQVRLTCWLQT